MAKSQGSRTETPERSDIVEADAPDTSVEPQAPPEKESPKSAAKADAPKPAKSIAPARSTDPLPLTPGEALTPQLRAWLSTPVNRRPRIELTTEHDALARRVRDFAGDDQTPALGREARQARETYIRESDRLLRAANDADAALERYKKDRARARGAETVLARSAPTPLAAEFAAATAKVASAERELTHAQREESKFAALVRQSDTAIGNLEKRLGSRASATRSDRAPLKAKHDEAVLVRNRRADELESARSLVEAARRELDKATTYAERVKAACIAEVLAAIAADPPAPPAPVSTTSEAA